MVKILITIICVLVTVPCWAADKYVRKGATGNGTSWTDAWGEMDQIVHSSLSAGDTVWLAGGSYTTPITFTKSGTDNDNRIYFKRVRTTDAVPTAADGWNASYDSQVIISPTAAPQSAGLKWAYGASGGSWVTVDGRIDKGIKISVTVQSTPNAGAWGSGGMSIMHTAQGVTVRYVEMAGPGGSGMSDPYTSCNDESLISLYGYSGWGVTISDIIIEYCDLHGLDNTIRHAWVINSIIRNNKLYDNYSLLSDPATGCASNTTSGYHVNNVISTGASVGTVSSFYNNEIYHSHIEGLLIGNAGAETPETWYVYNNVFHSPLTSSSRIVDVQYAAQNIYLYNNTIANYSLLLYDGAGGGTFSASSKSRNNLIYNSSGAWDSKLTDSSYNWNNSSPDPFVSVAGDNYHLSSAVSGIVGSGLDLTSYGITALNSDKDAVARGASWDIGAYEYGAGSTPPSATGCTISGGSFR